MRIFLRRAPLARIAQVLVLSTLTACADPTAPPPAVPLELSLPETLYAGEASYVLVLPDTAADVHGFSIRSSNEAVLEADAFGRLYPRAAGRVTLTAEDHPGPHPRVLATSVVDVQPAREGVRRVVLTFATNVSWTPTLRRAAERAAMRWQRVLSPNPRADARTYPLAWCFRDSVGGSLAVGPDLLAVAIEQFAEDTAATRTVGYGGACIRGRSGTPLAIQVAVGDRSARADASESSQLEELIVHEIGHGLGLVGLSWDYDAVASDPVLRSSTAAWFTGPHAVAAWQSLERSAGSIVPLDPDGLHWSRAEAAVMGELMYPFLSWGSARVGVLTLGALADIGNPVRLDRAEPIMHRLGIPGTTQLVRSAASASSPDVAFPGHTHLAP